MTDESWGRVVPDKVCKSAAAIATAAHVDYSAAAGIPRL